MKFKMNKNIEGIILASIYVLVTWYMRIDIWIICVGAIISFFMPHFTPIEDKEEVKDVKENLQQTTTTDKELIQETTDRI